MVLLTDGDPAPGPASARDALRRPVAHWVAVRQASIDCATIGQGRAWLRELPAETGGGYLSID